MDNLSFAIDFVRCFIAQLQVWSFFVVNLDRFSYQRLSQLHRNELFTEHELNFQDAIDPLGDGILIDMAIFGHTDCDISFEQIIDIRMAAILDTAIGMVDQLFRLANALESHFERSQAPFDRQASTDVIANNFT